MRRRSGFGWLALLSGILLIVLGIWAFANPAFALAGMVFVYGVAAVMMAIADLVLYIQVERYTGFGPTLSLVSGILSVMAGVMLVVYPGAGVRVLTLLFPLWFIAHSVSRLAHLRHIRLIAGRPMYYVCLGMNILGLCLGLLMLLSPLFTLATIRVFASAYLILLGIDSIALAVSRLGMRR